MPAGMETKYIVFDFDGTIADTLDMAFNMFNGIAGEYNCRPVTQEDRHKLRTQRPQELLKKYGVTNLKMFSILLRMRKELSNRIPEIDLIKDMEAALHEIKNAGFRLGILTSNSRDNVSKFLENKALTSLFDFIYSGNGFFGKARVIRRLLEHENISVQGVIYVGDETRDVEASKKAGIPVIAVSWGFSSRDVLASLQPDQIADEPEQLPGCVHRILHDQILP